MGFLDTQGPWLEWDIPERAEMNRYIKEHGLIQLLNLFNKFVGLTGNKFLYGDEIEYLIYSLDEETRTVRPFLRTAEILDHFNELEKQGNPGDGLWRPEYAIYMLESTPAEPYTQSIVSAACVEVNMRKRLEDLQALLGKGEIATTMTSFLTLGSGSTTIDAEQAGSTELNPYSASLFVKDQWIQDHQRYKCLTKIIRSRRGERPCILIPMYIDEKTIYNSQCYIDVHPNSPARCSTKHPKLASELIKDTTPKSLTPAALHFAQYYQNTEGVKSRRNCCQRQGNYPSIYMDAPLFGMGCSCLQITLQMPDVTEARRVYDQLAVLCPVFLALSASSPVYKGILADVDVRWLVISAAMDDRTVTEVPKIMKSRYDSVSTYISEDAADYNDIKLAIDEDAYNRLRKAGLDDSLAKHFAHLFIRDPLVIFENRIEIDDEAFTDHFENIQSTNWQTVRFKPPPHGGKIGWRVEFRVLDNQPSPFDAAAYVTLTTLLTQALLQKKVNFYIPISYVDVNMAVAHQRDAVLNGRFYFRSARSNESRLMSTDEIFNGSSEGEGLITIAREYLAEKTAMELANATPEEQKIILAAADRLESHLRLLELRASGKVMTVAKYWRNFVLTHKEYKKDSVVTESMAYDMIQMADKISRGAVRVPELYGELADKAAYALSPEASCMKNS